MKQIRPDILCKSITARPDLDPQFGVKMGYKQIYCNLPGEAASRPKSNKKVTAKKLPKPRLIMVSIKFPP